MKSMIFIIFSCFVSLPSAFGQGTLTPPGVPAPTMITLSQIEPRTPISSAPFVITNPGSYYLTTNIVSSFSDAIIIATNHVTLDLNGFTISSSYSGNAGSGIWLDGANMNIAIFNGHIISGITNNGSGVYSGPGFFNGITYTGPTPQNVRVSDLTVWGTVYYGINVGNGNSTLVENCQARTIGSYGIICSTVKSSSATDIGSTAISGDRVDDCLGYSAAIGYGISCLNAQNCTGYGNGSGPGISANTVTGCYGVSFGTGDGISCSLAQGSYGGANNSGNGITTYGNALNCYGSSSGGYGISAYYTAESCFGQSVSGVGLVADVAVFCTAARSGGRAIQATIGNSCFAASGTNFISLKYNMP